MTKDTAKSIKVRLLYRLSVSKYKEDVMNLIFSRLRPIYETLNTGTR
jgi:hypothetical protein